MKTTIGGIILVIGVIFLFIGIAAPSTSTQSAETCVDAYDGGQNCVQTTYESPNYGKISLLTFGVVMIFSGGILHHSQSSSSSTETSNHVSDDQWGNNSRSTGSLAEQIRNRNRGSNSIKRKRSFDTTQDKASSEEPEEQKQYSINSDIWSHEIIDYNFNDNPVVEVSKAGDSGKFIVGENIRTHSQVYEHKYGAEWVGKAKEYLRTSFEP